MQNKTVVLTGVTGQDGGILAHKLLEQGYNVVGTKRRTSSFNTNRIDDIYDHPNFFIEYFDLCDASSINRIVSYYKPDYYINLAAQSFVKASFDCPEDTINGIVQGTLSALEAIKNISPKTKFYQASSSEQFGISLDIPIAGFNENSKFMPASPYAIGKVAAHHLVQNYRYSYGLHASCGILFNHEHETRGETFVTRKISMAAAKIKLGLQDKLTLGNLSSMRDWGYAPEFCDGIWQILQQETPNDYVLATGEVHSVLEFAKAVFEYADLDLEKYLQTSGKYHRPQEVLYLKGDYSRAFRTFGWNPTITFKQIARLMYTYDYRLLRNAK